MDPVRSGCFRAVILFLAVCLRAADCMTVIAGNPFEIPVSCEPDESGSLLRVSLDSTRQVASYRRGQWTVSAEYRDRMESNSSKIVFTHMQYNDGGVYEVTCYTTGTKKPVQLEVVHAEKPLVTEGDNVMLPCYYKTKGKPGLTVLWEKNGKPLCVKNCNYEGCNGTPDVRYAVPTDWITSGNLSLTIERVQPEDSGDYFCYIRDQHGEQPGTPAAVRLTVTDKMTHQMNNNTAGPGNKTQSCGELTQPWQISTWILLVMLLLVAFVALVAFLCLWHRGKISCDSGNLYEMVVKKRSCHPSNSNEAPTIV